MLKLIIQGWKNYLLQDSVGLATAIRRAKSCAACKYAVKGTYEQLMPDSSIKEIEGLKCDKCNCPLSTATRSLDKNCPIGRW